MKTRTKQGNLISRMKYLFFEKKFSTPRASVLALLLVPLVAYPLVLSDYENTATVLSSPDQFETDTTNNESTIQVTPNAEIVIVKQVVNDDGGSLGVADFNIATSASAGALNFATVSTAGDTTTYTADKIFVPAGTYTLTETNPVAGYTAGDWSCTAGILNDNAADSGELVLDIGESAVCTIVNDDIGPQLTLVKNIVNDDGGDLLVSAVAMTVDGNPAGSGVTQTVLANTAITIAEAVVPGYTQETWECTEDNLGSTILTGGIAGGDTITLAPGAVVTCEITNDDIAPTVMLSKTIINDNGGDELVDVFDITISSLGEVPNGIPQPVTANTDITISELPHSGYNATDWTCTDANDPAYNVVDSATGTLINIKPGAVVTCAITNDDIAPTITLVKNVINDNGGSLNSVDFPLFIDTTSVNTGAVNTVLANQQYVVSEAASTQYAEGDWSCTDANDPAFAVTGTFDNTQLTLLPGAVVTCEITNNDLGIDLAIDKFVSNSTPNVGDTIKFTLRITNAGPDIATNATVSDIVLPGFTYVAGSIAGGTSSDDTDPTGVGLGWTLASVPVGTPIDLVFDVIVNAP